MEEIKKYDTAEFLDTAELQAEYLKLALENDTPHEIIEALQTGIRARGLAEKTEPSRTAWLNTFEINDDLTLSTFMKVMHALGFTLSVK